jgi:hypothetical protein
MARAVIAGKFRYEVRRHPPPPLNDLVLHQGDVSCWTSERGHAETKKEESEFRKPPGSRLVLQERHPVDAITPCLPGFARDVPGALHFLGRMARRGASRWTVVVAVASVIAGCGGRASNGNASSGGTLADGGVVATTSKDAATSLDATGPTCPALTGAPSGKFAVVDQQTWEAKAGPIGVMITVKGGAVPTPLPTCPDRSLPCPERDNLIARWQAENLEAQRCVRQLVVKVGGTVDPAEVLWLLNDFVAYLTWPQIETVATQPDVVQMVPNEVPAGNWGG